MPLKAVLFDLWETLVTDAPELQRARQLWRAANVRAILEVDGLHIDLDVLDDALVNTSSSLSASHNGGTDTDAAGRVSLFLSELQQAGAALPRPETHEALITAICTMPEGLYPAQMPGALEAIAAIKAQGLKTALVSNAGVTTAPTLREMLAYYGLAPHLDAMVFSDEMLLAKPSAAMFTTALEAIGCNAADAVFVGDSARHDVAGVQPLGIYAIQLGGMQIEGIKPDARIESLGELAEVITKLDQTLVSLKNAGA